MNKIIIITGHFPPKKGGVETNNTYYLDVIEESKNITSVVITYENRYDESFCDYWKKSKVIRIKIPTKFYEYMISLNSVSRLNTSAKKSIYLFLHVYSLLKGCFLARHEIRTGDVILAKGAIPECLVGYITSLITGKKFCIRWHNDIKNISSNYIIKFIFKMCFNKASKIIINGKDNADYIKYLIKEKLDNKIIVAKHPIDIDIFYPMSLSSCKSDLNLSNETFIILYAAALNETKFCDLIVNVASELLRFNSSNFFFVFIGEGPLFSEVHQLLKQYPLNVKFVDKLINQQELASFINTANIVAGTADVQYPSRLVLETLACGVPVLLINTPISDQTRKTCLKFTIDLPQVFIVNPTSSDITQFIVNNHEQITKVRKNEEKTMSSYNYVKSNHLKQKVINEEIHSYFKS